MIGQLRAVQIVPHPSAPLKRNSFRLGLGPSRYFGGGDSARNHVLYLRSAPCSRNYYGLSYAARERQKSSRDSG